MRFSTFLQHIILTFTVCLCSTSLKAEYHDHRGYNTDSLETALRSGRDLSDQELSDIYYSLMWGFLQTDGEKAFGYAEKLHDLTSHHHWYGRCADALRIMGQTYWVRASYEKAEECYNRALDEIRKAEEEKALSPERLDNQYSVLYGTLGNLYNIQGMSQLATHYYMQALEVFERTNQYEMMTTLYFNMGEMFMEMENYAKADELYGLSMKNALQSQDSLMINMPKKGLALCRLYEGKTEEALQLALESERYFASHPEEETSHASAWTLISRIYLEGLHDTRNAEHCIQKAQACMDKASIDDRSGVFLQLAKIQEEQGKYREALLSLERAGQIFEGDDAVNVKRLTLKSRCLVKLGQAEQALGAMSQAMELEKRISNKNYQSSISEQETLYQIEKKEAEIQKEKAFRRQYQTAFYLALALLLFLSATLVLVIRLKKKQRVLGETRGLLEKEEEMNLEAEAQTGEDLEKTVEPNSAPKTEKQEKPLTSREEEILQLIAKGCTNPQIAEKIFLSPETVKWYRKRLLQKFGVTNTAALIAKAMQDNLIDKDTTEEN